MKNCTIGIVPYRCAKAHKCTETHSLLFAFVKKSCVVCLFCFTASALAHNTGQRYAKSFLLGAGRNQMLLSGVSQNQCVLCCFFIIRVPKAVTFPSLLLFMQYGSNLRSKISHMQSRLPCHHARHGCYCLPCWPHPLSKGKGASQRTTTLAFAFSVPPLTTLSCARCSDPCTPTVPIIQNSYFGFHISQILNQYK